MKRLIPTVVLGSMLLGGTALAQSFEPPSIPGFSGVPDVGVPQIDPPSLQFDTGPVDTNDDGDGDTISDLAEAIITVFDSAWEGQPGEGPGEAFNPDLFNPGFFAETDPGIALLELLGAIVEEVRKGLQQGRVLLDSDFGP